MTRNELLNWAIKGLETEIATIETQLHYDKGQLAREEKGLIKLAGTVKTKIRKRVESNLTLKEELDVKLFNLRWEIDINE